MQIIDLIGQRFTRLTVVSRAPNKSEKDTNARWNCVCDCGNTCIAYGQDLRREKFKSCGCLQAENRLKHGMHRTRTYRMWLGMRQRCENPKASKYENYGGRGIRVCDRWLDFTAFYADMGEAPEHHSLDRIDGNGNYEPGNCRWATVAQQNRNKRTNVAVTIGGSTKVMQDWCIHYGIKRKTVDRRIRDGWNVVAAITTPVHQNEPKKG